MEQQLLLKAKKDLPKYLNEFNNFWNLTANHILDEDLSNCYHTSILFKNWQVSLNYIGISKVNSIFFEVHEDINASLFHAYFGNYRSAHMHLRSVIELSLQILYFYQHEVEYLQWQNGEFRIKHDELSGYLKRHPNLQVPEVENLLNQITVEWKKFSKHIHAETPLFFQTELESKKTKKISKRDFNIWKGNYLKTGYLINLLFLIFYRDKLTRFQTKPRELLLLNLKPRDFNVLGIEI